MAMKATKVEILFSETQYREDGTKGNETSVVETLDVEWDSFRNKVKASNSDGDPSWVGYGAGHTEAILNYLQKRLGVEKKTMPVRYSNRIY
jgi:hypothetical protein